MYSVNKRAGNAICQPISVADFQYRYKVWSRRPLVIRVARPGDRDQVIAVINAVAGERRYLQTDRYVPTPAWEQLLGESANPKRGLLLTVVESDKRIVGFARLTREGEQPPQRSVGSIGMALLPSFRYQGIGTRMLGQIIASAPEFQFCTLTADILADNLVSLRLFNKYKFVPEVVQEIYLPFRKTRVAQITVESSVQEEA